MSPEHLLKLENVAGSATYKQRNTVWDCVVLGVIIQLFMYENKESVLKKEISMTIFFSSD